MRTPMPAGHVILVLLIAFGVGTVLNATGMFRTAANQGEGWQRDVGMAIMRPIRWVSIHTGLSKPREWLLSAAGQNADSISTALPKPQTTVPSTRGTTATTVPGPTTATTVPGPTTAPTTLTTPVTPTTSATPPPVMTPSSPLRMIIVGDSLVATPGKQLLKRAGETKVIGIMNGVDSRVSTGLGRPDFVVNWSLEIKRQTDEFKPDAVVIMIGANDDHDLQTGSCNGKEKGRFRSASWEAEYRCRVGGLMDQIITEGRKVIWVGIPIIRDPAKSDRFQYLNSIYRSEAEARPGNAFYVDTYPLLQPGGNGGYADYLDINGEQVKVRADDGVHFDSTGGRIIADEVMKLIRAHWDVDSWRNGVLPSTTAVPTTAVPTTAAPTTAVPTTAAPTTAAPPTTAPSAPAPTPST